MRPVFKLIIVNCNILYIDQDNRDDNFFLHNRAMSNVSRLFKKNVVFGCSKHCYVSWPWMFAHIDVILVYHLCLNDYDVVVR